MTPTEQGRHCASCATKVIDFSIMSNEEIVAFLENQNSKVCGRVKSNQLANNFKLSENFKKFIYAFALVFLATVPLTTFSQVTIIQSSISSSKGVDPGGVDGKIKDAGSNPIPSCKVTAYQKGKIIAWGQSDKNGNFKIKPLAPETYSLEFFVAGYNKLLVSDVKILSGRSYTLNQILIQKENILDVIYIRDKGASDQQSNNKEDIHPIYTLGQIQIEENNIFEGPYPWYEMIDKLYFNK